jgi:pyruvate/2-oxoglutarate/acetoin dehydrogenase E1 component
MIIKCSLYKSITQAIDEKISRDEHVFLIFEYLKVISPYSAEDCRGFLKAAIHNDESGRFLKLLFFLTD